jgi:ferric iron reductase protein FhuF
MSQELIELRKLATDWRDYKLNNTSSTAEHIGMLFLHKRNFENAVTPDVVISMLDQIQTLQAENERLTVERDTNKRMRDLHFAEKSALAAKLATVEADAERLDYLQEGVTVELLYSRIAPKFRVGKHIAGTSHDIRAAIDAAKGGQQ